MLWVYIHVCDSCIPLSNVGKADSVAGDIIIQWAESKTGLLTENKVL